MALVSLAASSFGADALFATPLCVSEKMVQHASNNIELFIKEVSRVLKKEGVPAIWTYNLLKINHEIDKVINKLYFSIFGEFWDFKREMVENGYKDVKLPFSEIDSPIYQIATKWNMKQLFINPLNLISEQLLNAWGDSDKPLVVKWPLNVRIWRYV